MPSTFLLFLTAMLKNIYLFQDESFQQSLLVSVAAVDAVKDLYKPVRKYRRPKTPPASGAPSGRAGSMDEETKVQSTLLEYGK